MKIKLNGTDEALLVTKPDGTQIDLTKSVTEISHNALLLLSDHGELVAGRWYRITDYETLVSSGSGLNVAGHPFDIIVLAVSETSLSEEAYAIQNASDSSYFIDNNLAAWKLKYCITNDTSRFPWVSNSCKGVIYYMKDEFGNEAPYDFKNIQFKRYPIDSWADIPSLMATTENEFFGMQDFTDNEYYPANDYATLVTSYSRWYFTFNDGTSGAFTDASLTAKCRFNVIKPYIFVRGNGDRVSAPNNIVMMKNNANHEIIGNYFAPNCRVITLGTACSHNKFDYDCFNIVLGTGCQENTFGLSVQSTYFGNICCKNEIKCGSFDIEFKTQDNSFKGTFEGVKCGATNSYVYCDYCQDLTMGTNNNNIKIGDNCARLDIGSYFQNLVIEDGVEDVEIDAKSSANSLAKNVRVCMGVYNTSITAYGGNTCQQVFKNGKDDIQDAINIP